MNLKTVVLRVLGFAALVVLAAVAVPRAEIIEQVLLKVNGEVFTKSDLESRQVASLRQMGQQIDPKSNPSDAQLRKLLDEITPRLLVDVVDEMLLVQRGKELGYKMTDEEFQRVIESLRKDNKLETDEEFQAALKQEGMTMADLKRNLERQWLASRVQQNEVMGRVAVTEDEARRYYDSHKNEFTTPSAVTLREILVPVAKDASVADDAAAKTKAAEIRQRALAGESFEKLAADFSDAPSKANGGLIGPLNLSDVSADLRQIIEQLKPGELSEPLRAQTGYEILKLESSSTAQTMPFEQARADISNRVFTDKRKTEYDKYLDKLRTEAIIDWKNDDVKKAYEAGLVQLKAGAAASQ